MRMGSVCHCTAVNPTCSANAVHCGPRLGITKFCLKVVTNRKINSLAKKLFNLLLALVGDGVRKIQQTNIAQQHRCLLAGSDGCGQCLILEILAGGNAQ